MDFTCVECGRPSESIVLDDNPGKDVCRTCEEWRVRLSSAVAATQEGRIMAIMDALAGINDRLDALEAK